jgi:two-component system, NarL family, response regulator
MSTFNSNSFQLSERELEVLALLTEGKRNQEIAAALCITQRTAEHHVNNIRRKLSVRNRTEAAMAALKRGIIQPEAK